MYQSPQRSLYHLLVELMRLVKQVLQAPIHLRQRLPVVVEDGCPSLSSTLLHLGQVSAHLKPRPPPGMSS